MVVLSLWKKHHSIVLEHLFDPSTIIIYYHLRNDLLIGYIICKFSENHVEF
jgi:hypothetical protein